MCCRTRYAHCVSADLYHIEFGVAKTYRIATRQIYRAERSDGISTKIKIASVDTEAVLVKKKGRGILTISRPFPVGRYIQFHTALPQVFFVIILRRSCKLLYRSQSKRASRASRVPQFAPIEPLSHGNRFFQRRL